MLAALYRCACAHRECINAPDGVSAPEHLAGTRATEAAKRTLASDLVYVEAANASTCAGCYKGMQILTMSSKGIPAKGGHEPVTEDGGPLTLLGCIQPMGVACLLAQLLLVPPPALSHCVGLCATGVPETQLQAELAGTLHSVQA